MFLLHYLHSTLQAPRFGSSVWGQVRNIRWGRLTPSELSHAIRSAKQETKRVTCSEHQLTHNHLRLFWDVHGCSGPLEESGASWVCLSTVSDVRGPMPGDKMETLLQCCLNMLGSWESLFLGN